MTQQNASLLAWLRRNFSTRAGTRALVSPGMDFMLVGGLSIITLGVYFLISDAFKLDVKDETYLVAGWLSFVINYPHFAYSYMLFYKGFVTRLFAPETEFWSRVRMTIAGLLVPAVMVAYFIRAYVTQNTEYIMWALFTMIFTVGWHYVKQAYGVLITMSVYRNIFYALWEKRILWINAYAVWAYSWCRTNSTGNDIPYRHIQMKSFHFPLWVVDASFYFACFTTAACIAIVLNRWLAEKKGISFNAVVGYACGIYMWVMIPFMNMAFYILIPMFHSLQYLPFVYKFKKSELVRELERPLGNYRRSRRNFIIHAVLFTLTGGLLGLLFFETFPNLLDDHYSTKLEYAGLDPLFFFFAFTVFINVHHFFIDSAFWRRDNKDAQQNLFRA